LISRIMSCQGRPFACPIAFATAIFIGLLSGLLATSQYSAVNDRTSRRPSLAGVNGRCRRRRHLPPVAHGDLARLHHQVPVVLDARSAASAPTRQPPQPGGVWSSTADWNAL
jgi:acyl dehydratase